eukprot:scaffold10473_cov25-Tisochrysis_lutea.AAC.1
MEGAALLGVLELVVPFVLLVLIGVRAWLYISAMRSEKELRSAAEAMGRRAQTAAARQQAEGRDAERRRAEALRQPDVVHLEAVTALPPSAESSARSEVGRAVPRAVPTVPHSVVGIMRPDELEAEAADQRTEVSQSYPWPPW